MGKRMTHEEIEQLLLSDFENKFILLEEYKGMNTKIRFKHNILECSHEWDCEPRSIINMKQGCPKCKGRNNSKKFAYTFDYVKSKIESEKGYRLLSNEYKNAKTKLIIKCANDNHPSFIMDWNHWQSQNSRCPICSNKKTHDDQKYPLSDLLLSLKEDKLEIVEWLDEYENRNSKFILQCENNHILTRTVGTYLNNKKRRGNICPRCSWIKTGKSISGNNHYLWKGGTTELRGYFQKQILQWKKDSMASCNYECIITGSKDFEIHHMYGFSKIIDEVFDITKLPRLQKIGDYTESELYLLNKNLLDLHYKYGYGICLSSDLHIEFHRKYGYGNNTPDQINDFIKSKSLKIKSK